MFISKQHDSLIANLMKSGDKDNSDNNKKLPSESDKGKKQKLSKTSNNTPNNNNSNTTTKVKKKKKGIKYIIMHPIAAFRKTDSKRESFIRLVDNHIDFFTQCPQIDCHLIAMAYIYFQRARPTLDPCNYSPDCLFYSLYLAWETEEDSTIGVEGIVHYVVGKYPSSRNKDTVMRKYEIIEWKRKLRQFHAGKDILWKSLNFNTYVDHYHVSKVLTAFPDDEVYRRQRKDQDLINYF